MKCARIRLMIDDHIKNNLSPSDAAAVDHHIRSCPECAAELASHEALLSLLHTEPDSQLSREDLADFLPGVWQKIESRRRASIRQRVFKFVPAVAAALIFSMIFLRPSLNVTDHQAGISDVDSSSLLASYNELLVTFLGSEDSEYVEAVAAEVFAPSYTLSGDDLDYYLQQIGDEDLKLIDEKLDQLLGKAG